MKKKLCSVTLAIALLLTSLLSITSLAAETSAPTDGATLFTGDTYTITAAGETLQLNLEEETTINRVKINEVVSGDDVEADTLGIQTFHIEVWNSETETWDNVYDNDYVGANRACILPEDYTTTAVRLVVDSLALTTTITSFTADYQAQAEDSSFMNVGYISSQWYEKGGFSVNADHMNTLTDLIMISSFCFDADGNFYIIDRSNNKYDYFSDDETEAAKAKSLMDGWVEKVENACTNYANGYSRLWICITALDSDAKTSNAFRDAETRTAFCEKVAQFALDYDLYGVDVDWEYPEENSSSLAAFQRLMVTLADTLHDNGLKCSGTVCPSYKHFWTSAMYEAVDYVSYMTYTNITDTDTVQAQIPYYYMDELIDYSIEQGCDASKIWIGVPYFGKYTDIAAQTFRTLYTSYCKSYGSLPKGLNIITYNGITYCYNGAYLLQDKVAYAVEKGCAGIMSWWIAQDILVFNDGETVTNNGVTCYGEDSLVRAVYEAIVRFTGVDMINSPEDNVKKLMGDVNEDDNVTTADALMALQAAVSSITLSTTQKEVADINGDGDITTADALFILQIAVGLLDPDDISSNTSSDTSSEETSSADTSSEDTSSADTSSDVASSDASSETSSEATSSAASSETSSATSSSSTSSTTQWSDMV